MIKMGKKPFLFPFFFSPLSLRPAFPSCGPSGARPPPPAAPSRLPLSWADWSAWRPSRVPLLSPLFFSSWASQVSAAQPPYSLPPPPRPATSPSPPPWAETTAARLGALQPPAQGRGALARQARKAVWQPPFSHVGPARKPWNRPLFILFPTTLLSSLPNDSRRPENRRPPAPSPTVSPSHSLLPVPFPLRSRPRRGGRRGLRPASAWRRGSPTRGPARDSGTARPLPRLG
jgi:hypothetical protein